MKVEYLDGFVDDLVALRDNKTRDRVAAAISHVESSGSLLQIRHLKKVKGLANHFRIRIGDHRLGFRLEKDTVVFMRCLPRKDIYRSFP